MANDMTRTGRASRVFAAILLLALATAQAFAGTKTWDGGGGDHNWLTGGNWNGDTPPVAGDMLVFAGTAKLTNTNNFPPNTEFGDISFNAAGFTLRGNSVILTNANVGANYWDIDNNAGDNTVALDIQAPPAGNPDVKVRLDASANTLTLAGDVSAPNGVIQFNSQGSADVQGSLDASSMIVMSSWNTGQMLRLAASNHVGPVTFWRGNVAVAHEKAFGDTVDVLLMQTRPGNAWGPTVSSLDLNGVSMAEPIEFDVYNELGNNGSKQPVLKNTGTAATLSGAITLTDDNPAPTNLHVSVEGSGDITITGQITGGTSETIVEKKDANTLTLGNNASDFSGRLVVSDGMLKATAINALGATGANNETVISNNAVLGVHGVLLPTAEQVLVGSGGGQIWNTDSVNPQAVVYSTTLNGPLTTKCLSNRPIRFGDPFTGNGQPLTHEGGNRVDFLNGVGDTGLGDILNKGSWVMFAGNAKPGQGTITLENTVASPLLVFYAPNHGGDSITNRMICNSVAYLMLHAGSLTDQNVYTLDYSGDITINDGAANFYLGFYNNATNDVVEVSGNIDGPGRIQILPSNPLPNANGTVVLSGNNTYAGITTFNTGTDRQASLFVNGTHTGAGAYTINAVPANNAFGALGGTGTISLASGTITVQGTSVLAPGYPSGTLTVSDLSMQDGSVYRWTRDGNGASSVVVADANSLSLPAGGTVTLDLRDHVGTFSDESFVLFAYTGNLLTLPTWSFDQSNNPNPIDPGDLAVVQVQDNGTNYIVLTVAGGTIDLSEWRVKVMLRFSGYTGGRTALTDFPALIVLDPNEIVGLQYADFDSPPYGDLRFSNEAGTEVLPYEVEKWDTAGQSYVWVKVPSLTDAGTAETVIYAYWGKSGCTAPLYTMDGSVWSENFVIVSHLDETSGSHDDSTSNNNSGTPTGGVTQNATGKADGGDTFDGDNDKVTYGMAARPTDTFTFGAWIKTAESHQQDPQSSSTTTGTSGQNYAFDPAHAGANGGAGLSVGVNGISVYEHGSGYMPPLAVYNATIGSDWNYIKVVYNGQTPTIYRNGIAVHTGLNSPRPVVYAPYAVGDASYGDLNGSMDEVRVSSVARTADWIWAEYMNMASNATEFITYGAATLPGAPAILNQAPTNITAGSAWVHADLLSTGSTDTAVHVLWGDNDGTVGGWDHTGRWSVGFWGEGEPVSTNLAGLAANDTHYYTFFATNAYGGSYGGVVQHFITGEVTIQGTGNGSEIGPVAGEFTVFRPEGTTNEDTTVNYVVDESVADSASEGMDYSALAGSVTLLSGSTSATITVDVQTDKNSEPAETVRLVITNGLYVTGSPPSSATITIANQPSSNPGSLWWQNRDATASGTINNPFWTDLQLAVDLAQAGGALPTDIGEVRISGDMGRTSGESQVSISSGYVRISGGWDGTFTTQSGRSRLDVNETSVGDQRGFLIQNAPRVTLDSIYLTDHEAQDGPNEGFGAKVGSGIYADNTDFLVLTNVVIHSGLVDYTSVSDGAGIYCRNSAGLRMSDCQFISNVNLGSVSNGQGGAISLNNVGTAVNPAIIEGTIIRHNDCRGNGLASALYHRGGGVLYVVNSHMYANDGRFTVNVAGSSTRTVLFGCLIEGNTENDASQANYIYPVYANAGGGVDSGNGYVTLANCTIASNRTSAAGVDQRGRVGGVAVNNGVAFQDSLNLINTIVAKDWGTYVSYDSGEYAYADLQACTFDGGTTNFAAEYANSVYTRWTNVVEAMTNMDDGGRYRFNDRDRVTGNRSNTVSGLNWQADPGLMSTGALPYALHGAKTPGATENAVDKGVVRVDGAGFMYIDIDHDATFTTNIDIVIFGSGYPANSLFVYRKDMEGNLRYQGGGIDRGYFETEPPPPPKAVFLLK